MNIFVFSQVLCLFWPPKYRHPAWSDYTLYVSQIVRPIHSISVSGIKPIDMLISKFSKIFSPKTSLLIPCLVPSLKTVTERPLNVRAYRASLTKRQRFLKLWTICRCRVSCSLLAQHGLTLSH